MNKRNIFANIALAMLAICFILPLSAQKVVIIATNDTHSQIDPSDEDGMGGVLRRKVVIDSIRSANENVLLIDAGDPVQGTMYFNLFKGEVENMVMNELGYDIRVLGNHEFDNGMVSLKDNLKKATSDLLSTNYRFDDPEMAAMFKPYLIKNIDGAKIGIIGVNLRPKGMIAEGNYDGVEYLDAMKAANSTAWHLKHNEGVDKVIAITHLGYYPSGTGTSDVELATVSEDIDLILGGHSHTVINPADTSANAVKWILPNAENKPVLVSQGGKGGKYLAVVEMDLNNDGLEYRLLPIDSRYDNRVDNHLDSLIEPYRVQIDEIMNKAVGKSAYNLDKSSDELLNLVADFIRDRGNELVGAVDFGLVNKGGIRRGLPKGTVTQGQIQTMLPFNNKVVVLELSGKDLLDNLEIMTLTGGNGVSEELSVEYDKNKHHVLNAKLNGKPIENEKIYKIATIDYLANGGDYMEPLTRGKWIAQSDKILYDDFLEMLTKGAYKGKVLKPSTAKRFYSTEK